MSILYYTIIYYIIHNWDKISFFIRKRSFKKVKALCYSEHKQGFYVYAKPNQCDPKNVVKYIGRYLGRPVIATSRIDQYDGESVTFHYNRHEDEKYVEEYSGSVVKTKN